MPELSDECFESLNFLANVYLTSSFAFKMIYECLEKDPLITIVTRKFRCLHRLARTNFQKTNNYLVEHGRCYIFRPNVGWSGVTYELGLILEEELQTQLNQVREIALAENNSRLVNFVDLLKGDNRPKAPPVDQPSSSQSQANKSENSANDKTEEEIEISIETKDDVSTITDDNDDDEGSKWNRESGSANETSSTNGQIDQEQFRRILVFNRPDPKTNLLAKEIITWLNREFPHLEIISENDNSKIDLVIVIGGDGTLLKAVSTFTGVVPPILGFRGGNLNYLLYYDIKGYRNTFKSIFTRGIQFQTRSRLSCKLDGREWSAVNDVCLHRGSNAQTISVNIQIEGQEVLVKGDGIIISTATGSTAYAGSAGGSVVHPMLDCLQVTPICSANLWQHSIILPKTSNVKLELIDGPSVFNIDGQNMMQDLEAGKVVEVSMDATPIRFVISEGSPDASNHWINALRSKCRFD